MFDEVYLQIQKAALEGDGQAAIALWNTVGPEQQIDFADRLGEHYFPHVTRVIAELRDCSGNDPMVRDALVRSYDKIESWFMAHD